MKDKKDCGTCKFWKLDCNSYPCIKCFNDQNHKHFVPKEEDDSVSHPNHYQSKSGLEVIDAIRAFTEDCEGIESYYTGNVIKYICRWKKKNGLEDLKKARQYLDWLIEKVGEKEPPKNGRYSMGENDCFVPWILKPHMAPSYTYPASGEYCCCESKMWESSDPEPNRPKDIVEIIWTEFWRIFYETLTEVSDEEKENKKDEE